MVRVLVIDDHPLVRRGIVQAIKSELGPTMIAEAANAPAALEMVRHDPFDVAVLDISLPGRSGLELLKDIKSTQSKLPVLVLSSFPESQFATRMLRAGAAGYLNKDSAPEQLIQALRKILQGGRYITPATADQLAAELSVDTSKPAHELLSDREYDVFLHIASGRSVSEIAERMNLSVKTVSTYRTRILDKMRLGNNAELANYAIRNGLVQ